jgi:hypothetical protein
MPYATPKLSSARHADYHMRSASSRTSRVASLKLKLFPILLTCFFSRLVPSFVGLVFPRPVSSNASPCLENDTYIPLSRPTTRHSRYLCVLLFLGSRVGLSEIQIRRIVKKSCNCGPPRPWLELNLHTHRFPLPISLFCISVGIRSQRHLQNSSPQGLARSASHHRTAPHPAEDYHLGKMRNTLGAGVVRGQGLPQPRTPLVLCCRRR